MKAPATGPFFYLKALATGPFLLVSAVRDDFEGSVGTSPRVAAESDATKVHDERDHFAAMHAQRRGAD
jgi:hypothetical protein